MSADAATPIPEVKSPGSALRLPERIDNLLERAGEWLNPILVKEARQSLKSRQFVLAFGLLLILAWGWSLIGMVWMGSDAGYGQAGPGMFIGYYCILMGALGVFVPFGAFRSLAGEQEDRTYELLSITGLSPSQIVSGKLCSALVQILIYLSAIAPCLAFTYMLRGISLPMILFVVIYTALGSLGLSVIGLLAGTLTGEKHWQVLLSVALIVGLLIVFFSAIGITSGLVFDSGIPFGSWEFMAVIGAMLTAYVTYFALVFHAAVAQITFASDNRSTKLRIVMLVQHACTLAWFGWLIWCADFEEEFLWIFLTLAMVHWAIMGALMTGEWPELSMRVKRRLPQSFLGRVLFTWFNPGPGTGYVFACCGMVAASLTAAMLLFGAMTSGGGAGISSNDVEQTLAFAVLAPAYVIAYLGTGLLIVRFLRRFISATPFLAALIQVILVVIGSLGPLVVVSVLDIHNFGQYTVMHVTNPFWSLMEIFDGRSVPPEITVLLVIVPFFALLVFLLNLPGILHEVRHTRIAKPKRVAEEDEQLAPTVPQGPVRISPWDEV